MIKPNFVQGKQCIALYFECISDRFLQKDVTDYFKRFLAVMLTVNNDPAYKG